MKFLIRYKKRIIFLIIISILASCFFYVYCGTRLITGPNKFSYTNSNSHIKNKLNNEFNFYIKKTPFKLYINKMIRIKENTNFNESITYWNKKLYINFSYSLISSENDYNETANLEIYDYDKIIKNELNFNILLSNIGFYNVDNLNIVNQVSNGFFFNNSYFDNKINKVVNIVIDIKSSHYIDDNQDILVKFLIYNNNIQINDQLFFTFSIENINVNYINNVINNKLNTKLSNGKKCFINSEKSAINLSSYDDKFSNISNKFNDKNILLNNNIIPPIYGETFIECFTLDVKTILNNKHSIPSLTIKYQFDSINFVNQLSRFLVTTENIILSNYSNNSFFENKFNSFLINNNYYNFFIIKTSSIFSTKLFLFLYEIQNNKKYLSSYTLSLAGGSVQNFLGN